jgi:N,N'-diacetyllegionaminate synthase
MNNYQTPYLIAEIGQAHEGSLGILYSYIDALAKTGVHAIKFQMHIAEAESSSHEPFRVPFAVEDDTRFDYWKRMGFTLPQWKNIKKHCDDLSIDFLCSPFSNKAVDWLEEVGVSAYKIGSGEVNNLLLLNKIAQTGKPIILSSGMSSFAELDETVAFLKSKSIPFSILQCATAYPTLPHQYGLNVIQELKKRYDVPVGFSDHSAKPETCIAAVALGAEIVEFHAVFDRQLFGPDSKASLTIDEISSMIIAIKNIATALQNPVDKSKNDSYSDVKQIFEKSLAINKDLPKGHVLTFEDLEAKKPRDKGVPANKYKTILGKKLKQNKQQWSFINNDDLI